jgi:type IV pilus assembly protein PilA
MTDAIWHHTDAAGQQKGPLTADAIRAGLASGEIPPNARFWRYGLADWVDRTAVAAELGLPPPVPPVVPAMRPGARPVAVAQPKKGMSGCLIGFIVGLVVMVPMVAILAAIAISQYQDYVTKSQFSEAPSIADGLKTQVVEAYGRTGACPANGDEGFAAPADYAGKYVARVELGGTAPTCVMTVTFKERSPGEGSVSAPLANQAAIFTGTDSSGYFQWTCEAPGLAPKYLPMSCRN